MKKTPAFFALMIYFLTGPKGFTQNTSDKELLGIMKAMEKHREETVKNKYIHLRNIEFEYGSSQLTASAKVYLTAVSYYFKQIPKAKLVLEGHTDNTGEPRKNKILSTNRAVMVRHFLITKGIMPLQLNTRGFGSVVPLASNHTQKGRRKNRRVELQWIGSSDDVPILFRENTEEIKQVEMNADAMVGYKVALDQPIVKVKKEYVTNADPLVKHKKYECQEMVKLKTQTSFDFQVKKTNKLSKLIRIDIYADFGIISLHTKRSIFCSNCRNKPSTQEQLINQFNYCTYCEQVELERKSDTSLTYLFNRHIKERSNMIIYQGSKFMSLNKRLQQVMNRSSLRNYSQEIGFENSICILCQ
ncbi:OmpA family protein [Siphonobacter sp. SORGH_AS_1065]|uniref:OmpA family protein n=1 Tax=Siphonobacter sp. SORGH_AS_1065 TaxID=3041795 RepID=UPI0027D7EE88|nr:OmpA family protein [Siphonobacter sp. SORGH_AS_1065]